MSEKPVRLPISGGAGERWLRIALNAVPSREEQLCVVLDCFKDLTRNSPNDGHQNAIVLLPVLSDLALPDYDSFYKNGRPFKGPSAVHYLYLCEQKLLFRKWLRENVYPILSPPPPLVSVGSNFSAKITGVACVETRIDILLGIIQGWAIERAEGDDREIYHTDAEECFWFICQAHAEFPAPQGDVLRGKIEDMIRGHLESNDKPIPGLLLGSWIARSGVPEGIARKMLHALVNSQPVEYFKKQVLL